MNAFWVCLRFVRYRFVKCRFARSKIYTFRFVCFQDVLKTSSRYVFKTSSRHVFKTSSRRLGRRKIVTLKTCWRRLQDVLKTNKCLLGSICILFHMSFLLWEDYEYLSLIAFAERSWHLFSLPTGAQSWFSVSLDWRI